MILLLIIRKSQILILKFLLINLMKLKKINDLNSKVLDFEKNKVSNESDPNVLSEDNNIRNDNDTKTTENKNKT